MKTTIGDLYGLTDHDPWDRRTDRQKKFDAKIRELEAKFVAKSPEAPVFIDPIDDERGFSITGPSPRAFQRITVHGYKLSAIYAMEPGCRAVALEGRNNAAGCWVVLSSKKMAQRFVAALQGRGVPAILELVGPDGQPLLSLQSNLDPEAISNQ